MPRRLPRGVTVSTSGSSNSSAASKSCATTAATNWRARATFTGSNLAPAKTIFKHASIANVLSALRATIEAATVAGERERAARREADEAASEQRHVQLRRTASARQPLVRRLLTFHLNDSGASRLCTAASRERGEPEVKGGAGSGP